MEIKYKTIGRIHTEYKEKVNVPIQPVFSRTKGRIEIDPEYAEGLKDLKEFSHIILIYHLNRSKGYELTVRPFLDDKKRGVFATRAPNRPNCIGMSVVKLEKVSGSTLHVSDVDIVDDTPLLDIKPYIKEFDSVEDARQGWIEGKIKKRHKSDDRFS